MSKFRSASPTRDPTRDPTLVPQPQRIDPTGYTEFNAWLEKATVDQIDNYYNQTLKPEYDELGLRDTYGNIQNYTRIMKSIKNPGFMRGFFSSKPDLAELRSIILGIVDQINQARAMNLQRERERYAQSAQSEKMTTVPEALLENIRDQLYQCQQREINRKNQERESNKLPDRVNDARAALAQARSHAADSLYNDTDYKIKAEYRDGEREHLERLQRQQQQKRGGRSKRVKRSKRSKRVKRSKRSSTKRH